MRLDGLTEDLVTPASDQRLQRWLDEGSPVADLARILYVGDDLVRSLVIEVIAQLPPPVAWSATEWITWRECGRSAAATRSVALPRRDPPHDVGHEVLLCGIYGDDEIRGFVGHEIAHHWHAPIPISRRALPWMSDIESTARRIILGRGMGIDEEQLAQLDADRETMADRTCVAWGIARPVRPGDDLARARTAVNAAAEAVPWIERLIARRRA